MSVYKRKLTFMNKLLKVGLYYYFQRHLLLFVFPLQQHRTPHGRTVQQLQEISKLTAKTAIFSQNPASRLQQQQSQMKCIKN